MAKRKKYPRLPNGFGTIRYLGKGRRNPYAVHPPAHLDEKTGDVTDRPPALCYVNDYMVGLAVLTAYHAGTYKPGYELSVTREIGHDTPIETITNRILSDYHKIYGIDANRPTFAQVYERFYAQKFSEGHRYSKATMNSIRAAYNNCKKLHNFVFAALRYDELQSVIDSCHLKHASLEIMVGLLHQLYKYAMMNDICDKDYSAGLKIKKADDDERGVPFTMDELSKIYNARGDSTAQMLFIMCLSGFRITEYRTIKVDLNEWYFQGGSKTDAGKNRIVPIHPQIKQLVKNRIDEHGKILPESVVTFRKKMYEMLKAIGITEHHTPHDCRHTFSYLCEKYDVAENDRKRMLGHTFSDVTNKVYGHRDLEELRKQIEKIHCDFIVSDNSY